MATPEEPPDQEDVCQSGYRCTFIREEAEMDCWKCDSCHRVCRDPQSTTCGCFQFCASYTQQQATKSSNRPCPKCGAETVFYPMKRNYKEIMNFAILCNMKEYGCKWEGIVQDLSEHEKVCEYVHLPCPKCRGQIKKTSLDEHLKTDCPEREYSCPYCNYRDTYSFVTNAHMAECSWLPLECPNKCGVTGERGDMETHLLTCQKEYTSCKFQRLGCGKKFRREEEGQHMMECHSDPLVLSVGVLKMSEEIHDLKAKSEIQKNEIEQLKANGEIQKTEIDQLKVKSEIEKTAMEQNMLTKMAELQQKQNEEMGKHTDELRDQLKHEKKRVDSLEKQVSNMNNNTANDISPPEHLGDSERRELERKLEEKDRELEQLSRTLEVHKTESAEQNKQFNQRLAKLEKLVNNESRPKSNNIQPTSGPITFTLKGYSKLKESKEEWKSESFSVAGEGSPRVHLVVWPAGQGDGRGTHLSVWLGKEDNNWEVLPFEVSMCLELVDQAPHPTRNTIRAQKMFPVTNQQLRYPYIGDFSNMFIKHSQLCSVPATQQKQYLVEDSLKFRITDIFYKELDPDELIMEDYTY